MKTNKKLQLSAFLFLIASVTTRASEPVLDVSLLARGGSGCSNQLKLEKDPVRNGVWTVASLMKPLRAGAKPKRRREACNLALPIHLESNQRLIVTNAVLEGRQENTHASQFLEVFFAGSETSAFPDIPGSRADSPCRDTILRLNASQSKILKAHDSALEFGKVSFELKLEACE